MSRKWLHRLPTWDGLKHSNNCCFRSLHRQTEFWCPSIVARLELFLWNLFPQPSSFLLVSYDAWQRRAPLRRSILPYYFPWTSVALGIGLACSSLSNCLIPMEWSCQTRLLCSPISHCSIRMYSLLATSHFFWPDFPSIKVVQPLESDLVITWIDVQCSNDLGHAEVPVLHVHLKFRNSPQAFIPVISIFISAIPDSPLPCSFSRVSNRPSWKLNDIEVGNCLCK